jgi:predicted dehydrogenase
MSLGSMSAGPTTWSLPTAPSHDGAHYSTKKSDMKKIVLIGAGQLGRRHLQALANIDFGADIDVIDPFADSLAAARTQFDALPPNADIGKVRYLPSIAALAGTVDVAIVATNADVRADVVRALLDACEVKNVVLEKVLFQRPGDYAAIGELLESKSVNAWVNHPRRLFPFYNKLKAALAGACQVAYVVQGGAWGLACNGLHFLDHLAYLTGQGALEISGDGLNDVIIDSKRAGCVEFSGALRGRLGAHPFVIFCHAQPSPVVLDICSDDVHVTIDEANGWYRMATREGGWKWETANEKIVHFQSELTHLVVQEIVSTGACGLPTFAQACALHLPFLRCLMAHLEKTGQRNDGSCPIT